MKEIKNETRIAAYLSVSMLAGDGGWNPNEAAADAEALCRIGRSLNRIAEADCNYGSTPQRGKRWDRLCKKAAEITAKYDWNTGVQGYPRGACLRIFQDGEKDTGSNGIACL